VPLDIENNVFALPPWKTLMKYRVVVCSCLDANILATAQCTNKTLMRLEDDIVSALHPHRKEQGVKPHWTHLIIDEVGLSHLEKSVEKTWDLGSARIRARASHPHICCYQQLKSRKIIILRRYTYCGCAATRPLWRSSPACVFCLVSSSMSIYG
jgi:hypothetical protein